MKKHLLTIFFFSIFTCSYAQQFPKDSLLYNGPRSKMINLVILPDGYTSAELSKFQTDATTFMNSFMLESPFTEYKNYFNVYTIKVPSKQSGAKHPHTAADCGSDVTVLNPDNYFQSSFDTNGIDRLLYYNYNIVNTTLINNFPQWDIVLVLVNSTKYGGSGGEFAVASTNSRSSVVARHEIGHSFGGLIDEYYPGPGYMVDRNNLTKVSSPSLVRWKNWIGINDIGVYPFTEDPTWYRPHQNCRMRFNNAPSFCSYCKEILVEKIHDITNPINNYTPSETTINANSQPIIFTVNTFKPIPNTLKFKWMLDGNLLSNKSDSHTLNVSKSSHTLTVTVIDTTSFVKDASHSSTHLYSVQWKINSLPTDITVKPLEYKAQVNAYPNPFMDHLTIEYTLEKPSDIQVDLYDLNGIFIKTLVKHQNLAAGDYKNTTSINADKGIYLVRFSIDNMIFTKRVMKQ